ncbi:MAG TPA: hypothetical protein GX747_03015 [Tenericutes bacterium]|nr:hypothetical protein [Mycoplasmatota bacterium]
MNNYGFLIPANSKKSLLIFGLFRWFDLILFSSGIAVTLLLLLLLPVESLFFAIIALMPGVICGFLVMPVPNYHNILNIIKNVYQFYTTRQRYVWKGWCFTDGEENKK